jgi:hypothetical protein
LFGGDVLGHITIRNLDKYQDTHSKNKSWAKIYGRPYGECNGIFDDKDFGDLPLDAKGLYLLLTVYLTTHRPTIEGDLGFISRLLGSRIHYKTWNLLKEKGFIVEVAETCGTPALREEEDKEEDKEEEERKPRSRFAPPTLEEVSSYCKERNNTVDPEKFIAFYESKGWMIGKNKMKSWKAAITTWEKGRSNYTKPLDTSNPYGGVTRTATK